MSTMATPSESVIVRKMANCASEMVWVAIKLVQSTASLHVGVVKPPCGGGWPDLDTKQTKCFVKNIFLLIPDSGSSAWYPQAEGSQEQGSCRVQLVQHDLVDRPIVCICILTCCVNITFLPLSSCFHGYLVHLSHGLSAVFS